MPGLTGVDRLDAVGVLEGLGAAVGLAVYLLVSADTATELPPLVLALSNLTVGAFALAVLGLTGAVSEHAPRVDVSLAGHRISWALPILWLSIGAAVIAYVSGIGSARRLDPTVSSFVGLTEVLFAVGFAWAVGVVLVRIDELRPPAPKRGSTRRRRQPGSHLPGQAGHRGDQGHRRPGAPQMWR